MNKNIKNFIITIVLAIVLSLFFPWYSIMIAGLFSAMITPLKKAAVFFVPFLAILVYWSVHAYLLSSANDFTLARKIAELLTIGNSTYLLIFLTGVIGGLAAGISAILGKQLIAGFK